MKATLTVSAYVFGDGTTPPVPGGRGSERHRSDLARDREHAAGSVRACRRDGGGSMSRESVKSLAEKRVRRQKIFIAVGTVVLLAVLGFELPKMMGGKGGSEAAAPTTVPASAAGAAPVVPAGKLPNTDQVVVHRDSNQLISFGLFKSKDPFVQQLSTTADAEQPAAAPSAAGGSAGAPAAPRRRATPAGPSSSPTPAVVPPGVVVTPTQTPATGGSGSTGTPPAAATPAAPVAAPTEALIATNGVCERVSVAGTFPTDENIFRLVSIAKNGKSVDVGIVGGSFDNGHPTATLKLGEKITLVNTADGTRYEIVLKTSCNLATPSGGATTTQPNTTTPVAPAPTTTTPADTAPATTTTTATTPIVTDSLDTTTPAG